MFRCIDAPSYEERVWDQIEQARKAKPGQDLTTLLRRGDVWRVGEGGEIAELNR